MSAGACCSLQAQDLTLYANQWATYRWIRLWGTSTGIRPKQASDDFWCYLRQFPDNRSKLCARVRACLVRTARLFSRIHRQIQRTSCCSSKYRLIGSDFHTIAQHHLFECIQWRLRSCIHRYWRRETLHNRWSDFFLCWAFMNGIWSFPTFHVTSHPQVKVRVELHESAGFPVAFYFPATQGFIWAILDLNQRLLPCEGSTLPLS